MNKPLDKKVCELLIKAQMCSDSGKNFSGDYGHPEWKSRADKWGYSHKTQLICSAFDRISQLKGKSGFAFYVGVDSKTFMTVAYFNFTFEGKRYQISFHCPYGLPERYNKANKSHYTKWNGIRFGSIEAVNLLSWYIS